MNLDELINQYISMASFDEPDYTMSAGNLLMEKTHEKVLQNRGYIYGNLNKTLETLLNLGIYDERLKSFSKDEISTLNSYIVPERDMLYDYAGANIFTNRYLTKHLGEISELPQEVFMIISMLLSIDEPNRLEYCKKFYDAFSLKKLSMATPILANLRIKNGNLSSCFITAIDDNIESIFYNVDSVAKISKNGGGVGVNISRIRAKGSMVNGYLNASGGVIPWIKILNDTAVAVNQQGRRAGAVTIALDIWHLDIENFLELQTENGDLRGKAYDIYPQIVIPDIFMERVRNNEAFTLFDPYEIRKLLNIELCELYGQEFEDIYLNLESREDIKLKKIVQAKELFKEIMKVQIETGMPYLFFKDRANYMNHNKHLGMIGNGNLCMESFSNFSPSKNFKETSDGDEGITTFQMGETHTCNLLSLNLAEMQENEIPYYSQLAVRILDNTIDLTVTPLRESNKHNNTYRTIGVGAMGLADYLADNYMIYEESQKEIGNLFELISLNTLLASSKLAKERGQYPAYIGSQWDKGIFFGKTLNEHILNSKYSELWTEVGENIKKYGLRNGELTAIAPNTSTSLLMGSTASVNPTFARFFIEKNQKGAVPRAVKHLKEKAWFYPEFKNVDSKIYVKIMGEIGKWITQGVSMELIFDLNKDIRAKDIYDTLFTAWENGCKSVYYIRTIQKNSSIATEKEECESCSG